MRKLRILFLFLFVAILVVPSWAVNRDYQQVDCLIAGLRDGNGYPLSGGLVHFYLPGTTTPTTVYQDLGTTPHTNPVVLDAYGRRLVFVNQAVRMVITDATGVPILDYDLLAYGSGIFGPYYRYVEDFTSTTGQTVFWLSGYGASCQVEPFIGGVHQASGTYVWAPPTVTFSEPLIASLSVEFVIYVP